mmetsp:Transcript_96976/g.277470  ORF Transcript_96976/g.277470 Transcript_96976/m.277470 type:complete len:119 (-) Transcript_96976:955-1311(-)
MSIKYNHNIITKPNAKVSSWFLSPRITSSANCASSSQMRITIKKKNHCEEHAAPRMVIEGCGKANEPACQRDAWYDKVERLADGQLDGLKVQHEERPRHVGDQQHDDPRKIQREDFDN